MQPARPFGWRREYFMCTRSRTPGFYLAAVQCTVASLCGNRCFSLHCRRCHGCPATPLLQIPHCLLLSWPTGLGDTRGSSSGDSRGASHSRCPLLCLARQLSLVNAGAGRHYPQGHTGTGTIPAGCSEVEAQENRPYCGAELEYSRS